MWQVVPARSSSLVLPCHIPSEGIDGNHFVHGLDLLGEESANLDVTAFDMLLVLPYS